MILETYTPHVSSRMDLTKNFLKITWKRTQRIPVFLWMFQFYSYNSIAGVLLWISEFCQISMMERVAEKVNNFKFHRRCLKLAHLNPFVPIAPFLYPLKTSENRKVFRR